MWIKLLSVFGFGMIGLWEGIPAGYVLKLNPLVIGVVSGAGSLFATLLVLLLGDRLRARLLPPRVEGAPRPERRERMIDRVWRRYGVIGLGLLAPAITGAPLGVALGLYLRAPLGQLIFWATTGVALWAAALTTAGSYGAAGVSNLIAR